MSDLAQIETLPVELQKLSVKHKEVASLLAQGMDRGTIAAVVKFTPEYITWLKQQPLMIQYIKEMSVAVSTRLEALYGQSVDVIADTMRDGTEDGKLKAAKLQLEATGRVGRFQSEPTGSGGAGDKLESLAERLVGLLEGKRRRTVDGSVSEGEVSEATVISISRRGDTASSDLVKGAQPDGS